MQRKIKDLCKLFKTTYTEWLGRDPFRQSAVIAYYAIFSIPGLLVLIINIIGSFYTKDAASQSILAQVSKIMGVETAKQIEEILVSVSASKSSMWTSIFGVIILVVGSTGVFVELQKTLNQIWQVKVTTKSGIWPIIKARLFSFGLILAIAFLLLISLVVSSLLAAISNLINFETSGFMSTISTIINFLLSLSIISTLFALIFKILPDAKIKWKHVWLGSVVTGILFELGKTALAFYFAKANPTSTYGAAGSIILILLWVSYSSMILFFGAEFTATYALFYSGEVAPTKIAKPDHSHQTKVK
ncbi:MAG: YihY/virulence factor BrkB family protein [Bacteroidetes bacterium]|nr:YihY/virulence factor BrkB family protein [Bacteroidota bacterium]